jgi:ketosteroid isomerase-like protein
VPSSWRGGTDHAFVDDCFELNDGRILVLASHRGSGKRSGIELAASQTQTAHVFSLRDGRVARLVIYFDRDDAFADLGPQWGV